MGDLKDPRWMYAKAALLLLIGVACFGLLLLPQPVGLRALLQLAMIWGFARAYYFAFYVIERYIDPRFRFSGLLSFLGYLLRARNGGGR